MRRHKGERPFQCNQCNRGFTEQWALKKHLRLHTGNKKMINLSHLKICNKRNENESSVFGYFNLHVIIKY